MLNGVNRKRKPLYCRNLYGQNKQTNNQQRLQNYTDQNRKKYETIIEEITLQLTQVM
jgi:hypothetical protein